MDILISNKKFNIDEIKSISASDPNILFVNLKNGAGYCILLEDKYCPASQYLEETMKSLSILANKKIKNNKEPSIYYINLSPLEEIRYWYDEFGEIHVAVWSNGCCIVSDISENANIFKKIVKYILRLEKKHKREV